MEKMVNVNLDFYIKQIKDEIRRLIAVPISEAGIIKYEETLEPDGFEFEVVFNNEEPRTLKITFKITTE